MLRQGLKQQQLQKLSPQQIQLMKLLQVPIVRLEQRIKEELEANPMLEEGESLTSEQDDNSEETPEKEAEETTDEFELDDYVSDYMEEDPISYQNYNDQGTEEKEHKKQIPSFGKSLHEYLREQIGIYALNDPRKELIADQIIGSIDGDGYLRRDPMAICDDLLFSQNLNITEKEVQEVLVIVQSLDPSGIGARDLQETLLIQIEQKIEQDILGNGTLTRKRYAKQILEKHFEAFAKKHFEKLQKHLGITTEVLSQVLEEILKLNPKPSSSYSAKRQEKVQYVIPDFFVQNREGDLELVLNSKNLPDLRVNSYYSEMLHSFKHKKEESGVSKKEKETVVFIKNKIDSAKWFIDAILQRQQTLYKTMYAIMSYQKDYFMTGDDLTIRPMILKDIAELTGLDISTVSRVASAKYVQTEFGTKRLKEFFSESVQNTDGEAVSTLEVKKILEQVVQQEDKNKPLSDEKLKTVLKERGYNIARRTIAKYRDQLGIPVARLRRVLHV